MTLSFSPITRADIAGSISSFYGVGADPSAIDRLAGLVLPDVQRASAQDPQSWKSVVPGVLAKYESVARELGLGVSPSDRDRLSLRTANQTDAAFATALARLGPEALRVLGEGSSASVRERASGSRDDRASTFARDVPLTVSNAVGFAKELGINPVHAALFAGGSHEMRDALRDAIKTGKPITDDNVKSMKDVGMVLAAIRSGKMKADDPRVPESVKKVIEDMKQKGIDPENADQKIIQKYLNDNPGKLQEIKRQNTGAIATDAGQSNAQVKQRNQDAENRAAQKRKLVSTAASTKGKETSSKLGI
jgi:PBP1b-binding outer membrane lipoprotein LpoB